jgi:hypothetical protein
MAKATVTLPSGAKVLVEGTPDEVSALVAKLDSSRPAARSRRQSKAPSRSKSRPSPVSLISELIDGGFFKKPKELGAIKLALQEQGHFYPVTTLSPTMLRLVRRKELRRIKEGKRWLYVG